MIILPLSNIKRRAPHEVLSGLLNEVERHSQDAGIALVKEVKKYALTLRDYLRLAIDPTKAEDKDRFKGMTGYEAALCYLGLPVRDDFDAGITLELASDTFQTFPGTRAMFPEVIDDMLIWKYRQDQFESIDQLVSGSRTISGTELISVVVDDTADDYKGARPVAELARIPVRSIVSTEKSVKIHKFGMGYRTSYEFSRRARLDILTPYAARMGREFERSKVSMATGLLINGDGSSHHAAAEVVNQSTLTGLGHTPANGQLSHKSLLQWLVNRAKVSTPVDTVVGGWDAYIQWLAMFAAPLAGAVDTRTAAENMAAAGFNVGGVPILRGVVNFALSSDMPANQILGYSKADTLEELVEAGSLIEEQERAPLNQAITYVKTENSGCRFVFGDTRSTLNYGN